MQDTSIDLPEELRRAQDYDRRGETREALAILNAVAEAEDPFVSWIWYFAAIMSDRAGDSSGFFAYATRFAQSDITTDAGYRVAHVDLLVKRIVHLCRAKRDVAAELAALMRYEPSRGELQPLYGNLFEYVLPQRFFVDPDRTIKAPWRRWTKTALPIPIAAPHYAMAKPLHRIPVARLHTARRARYVTTGRDGGLWRDGLWFRHLGNGPSVEAALTHLRAVQGQPTRLSGRGLLVSDEFSGDNYCHWTMDWVPRILLAQELGGGFDWLFLRASRTAFQVEWLRKLGIDPFRIVFEDGIAWYEMDEFLYVDNGLIAETNPAYGGHPEIIKRIRAEALDPAASDSGAAPRRIYISRADGNGRGILNEAELVAMLSQRGFQAVSLGRLSLPEQIALFATADAVVAAHGAGLTNTVYMPRGALVVELVHHRYGTRSYSMSTLNAGLRYRYLTCGGHQGDPVPATATAPANATGHITAPIWVDTATLAGALDSLLA
jgi:capsular polysaccharide biosynthesis protein